MTDELQKRADDIVNKWVDMSWVEHQKAMDKAGNAQYSVLIPGLLLFFGGMFALKAIFPNDPMVGIPLMLVWIGIVGYYTKKLYSSVWDKIMTEYDQRFEQGFEGAEAKVLAELEQIFEEGKKDDS